MTVLQIARPVKILDQSSAQGDIQKLYSAADPKNRQTPGQRCPNQGQLPGIALQINLIEAGTRFFPVIERSNVTASA